MTLGFGNQYSIQLSYGRVMRQIEGWHSTSDCFPGDLMSPGTDRPGPANLCIFTVARPILYDFRSMIYRDN